MRNRHSPISVDLLAKPPTISHREAEEFNRKADEFFKRRGIYVPPLNQQARIEAQKRINSGRFVTKKPKVQKPRKELKRSPEGRFLPSEAK